MKDEDRTVKDWLTRIRMLTDKANQLSNGLVAEKQHELTYCTGEICNSTNFLEKILGYSK